MQYTYNKNIFLLGVGFEPTRLSPSDLKSDPLDHSGIPATSAAGLEPARA